MTDPLTHHLNTHGGQVGPTTPPPPPLIGVWGGGGTGEQHDPLGEKVVSGSSARAKRNSSTEANMRKTSPIFPANWFDTGWVLLIACRKTLHRKGFSDRFGAFAIWGSSRAAIAYLPLHRRFSDGSRMSTRHDNSPQALTAARRRSKPRTTGSKKGLGLTPRVRTALEALVFGIDGFPADKPFTLKAAAESANLTPRALREALRKPSVLAFYREQVNLLRAGEHAANLRTAIEIRDDRNLTDSAAGQRVRLLAAQQIDAPLEQSDKGNGVQVGVAVNVVTPGYVIDYRPPQREPVTIEGEVVES